MSGHSHWAGIKHRKGLNDAKRAGVFTKAAKLITIAARDGGGDPDTNFKLRLTIDQARSVNMPKENIERAIKRGTGELKDGNEIVEVIYEGYGPGNVAMLIKGATDNRNRTVSEVKSLLTKGGGKFVPEGSVSFMFQQVGEIIAEAPTSTDHDTAELQIIEAGADDIETLEENTYAIYTNVENLQKVTEALTTTGFSIKEASLSYRPTQTVTLSENDAAKYDALYEKLDDHDDVQAVYDNRA